MIAYFLHNFTVVNYQNQLMYVNDIAIQSSDIFWDTV